MKKIVMIITQFYIVCLPRLVNAQTPDQEWYKLQTPTNNTLRHLTFVDTLTGWAAGDSGTVIRTTDGGLSWENQNSTVQTFINDIFFLNKNLGWATTFEDAYPFHSIILKTTNGGEEWITESFFEPTNFIRTIFFFDSLNGLVGGAFINHTSDGGNTWIKADVDSVSPFTFPVFNFKFYNREFGYACGGRYDWAGVVWRTTNNGLNWSTSIIGTNEILDLVILDSLTTLALYTNVWIEYYTIKLQTTDEGLNWQSEDLNYTDFSYALDFRTPFEGWSASGSNFLYTSDKGTTWIEKNTPDSSIIFDLQFLDSQTGYACGDDGVILKYGSPIVRVEEGSSTITAFELEQNYPNPFNPSTKIKYSVPQKSLVQIKVYDVLGMEIETLVNEVKSAGTYEVNWHATNLPSGVYFYRLQAGTYVEMKKMILLK